MWLYHSSIQIYMCHTALSTADLLQEITLKSLQLREHGGGTGRLSDADRIRQVPSLRDYDTILSL